MQTAKNAADATASAAANTSFAAFGTLLIGAIAAASANHLRSNADCKSPAGSFGNFPLPRLLSTPVPGSSPSREGLGMSIIGWLILGLIAGFIASRSSTKAVKAY